MVTTEKNMTILRSLPDIHKEIAQAMRQFRQIVESKNDGALPSQQDKRVLELTELWLELQKEEAMGIPQVLDIAEEI